jgi:hypothetical protein
VVISAIVLAGFLVRRERVPFFPNEWAKTDFAQDYIGARALLSGEELYPILGPAHKRIGLEFEVGNRSTHPPTAFLLAVPLAGLGYPDALRLWALAMTLCMVFTARSFGLPWRWAIPAALLALTWPPATRSMSQYTPIWLLGLALGYRYRARPFLSGALVGLASLPKFLAAPALLAHLRRRQWTALAGFIALWLAAIGLLVMLRPHSFVEYLTANRENMENQILRDDNGALVIAAWRDGGYVGVASAAVLVLLVTWAGFRSRDEHTWACFSWLGVALLPIGWVYSLLPLLPWLVRLVLVGRVLPCALSVLALLSPLIGPKQRTHPWSVAFCIYAAGVAFLLEAMVENAGAVEAAAGLRPSQVLSVASQGEQPEGNVSDGPG